MNGGAGVSIRDVWRVLYGEDVVHGRRIGAQQYRVRCPFHADSNPSCDVSLAKDTWICRAGCGGGGCVGLVERELGVSPERAGAWLRSTLL
jgi:DNA primase